MSDNDQHNPESAGAMSALPDGADMPQASTTEPGAGGTSGASEGGFPPFSPYPPPFASSAGGQPSRAPAGRIRKAATGRAAGWVVAAAMAGAVIGLSISLATTPSATQTRLPIGTFGPGRVLPGGSPGFGIGAGSRAGTSGTVDSVSTSSFTMTNTSGSRATVDEQPSTSYRSGRTSATSSAVVIGDRVLVIGSTAGSTIIATEVIVLPAGGFSFGGAPAST